jgi:putative hydrolase of the HAD superfamily
VSVEALLFDLGGVVMVLDWDRAFSSWARDSGESLENLRKRHKFDRAYQRHERGEIGESEYYASLRDALGVDLDDEQLAAGWCAIFAGEIPETVELLRELKDRVALYALSNTNPEHQRVWSKQLEEALRCFRKVFVSFELGARKPEREAFEMISREIGVSPGRILFFDDTLANVEGARRAGLQAIHVKSPQDVADAVRRFVTPL